MLLFWSVICLLKTCPYGYKRAVRASSFRVHTKLYPQNILNASITTPNKLFFLSLFKESPINLLKYIHIKYTHLQAKKIHYTLVFFLFALAFIVHAMVRRAIKIIEITSFFLSTPLKSVFCLPVTIMPQWSNVPFFDAEEPVSSLLQHTRKACLMPPGWIF